jgi:hypothetical protein
MRRFGELVDDVRVSFPKDQFFQGIEVHWATPSLLRSQFAAYERAFRTMDRISWCELKTKALAHFTDHREGQLKQGFFNQLNEAFAYQHLARYGCEDIKLLREDGNVIPDLDYRQDGKRLSCEVKTIGISEVELARRRVGGMIHTTTYQDLSSGFLKKMSSTITAAWSQIQSRRPGGLVYLMVRFDDFTLMHYKRHRAQIASLLQSHEVPSIYVKVGVVGGLRISKSRPRPK